MARGVNDQRGMVFRRAANGGHLEMVQALLADNVARVASGARQVFQQRIEARRFQYAAQRGRLEVVQAILKGISAEDREEALQYAALRGRLEVVQFLLADDAVRARGDRISGWFLRGLLLSQAAGGGHLEVVQFLLADDADRAPGDRIFADDRGRTLRWAAEEGRLEVVQFLLADDAVRVEGDRISAEDRRALRDAAGNGHLEVVRALLADDVARAPDDRISAEDRGLALKDAASEGHLEVVQFLLADDAVRVEGDRISAEDRGEALEGARNKGYTAIIADLEDERRWLLIGAVSRGSVDDVKALLEYREDVISVPVYHRGIALRLAAQGGNSDVFKAIVSDNSSRELTDQLSAEVIETSRKWLDLSERMNGETTMVGRVKACKEALEEKESCTSGSGSGAAVAVDVVSDDISTRFKAFCRNYIRDNKGYAYARSLLFLSSGLGMEAEKGQAVSAAVKVLGIKGLQSVIADYLGPVSSGLLSKPSAARDGGAACPSRAGSEDDAGTAHRCSIQ